MLFHVIEEGKLDVGSSVRVNGDADVVIDRPARCYSIATFIEEEGKQSMALKFERATAAQQIYKDGEPHLYYLQDKIDHFREHR